ALDHARDRDSKRRAFGLWIVTAVMLSPIAWVHYLVLGLIPFAFMAESTYEGAGQQLIIWVAAAAYIAAELFPLSSAAATPRFLRSILAESASVSVILMYVAAYFSARRVQIA